jgi:hypothetical protein
MNLFSSQSTKSLKSFGKDDAVLCRSCRQDPAWHDLNLALEAEVSAGSACSTLT